MAHRGIWKIQEPRQLVWSRERLALSQNDHPPARREAPWSGCWCPPTHIHVLCIQDRCVFGPDVHSSHMCVRAMCVCALDVCSGHMYTKAASAFRLQHNKHDANPLMLTEFPQPLPMMLTHGWKTAPGSRSINCTLAIWCRGSRYILHVHLCTCFYTHLYTYLNTHLCTCL